MSDTTYLISEAAKKAGVESHVLRYWEEELSLPIARNEMGHRYYTKQDIQIFLSIKELKRRGFQLKTIKELVPKLEETAYTENIATGDSGGITRATEKNRKKLRRQRSQQKKEEIKNQAELKDKQSDTNAPKKPEPVKAEKTKTPSGVKVVVHRKDQPIKPSAKIQEQPAVRIKIGDRAVSPAQADSKPEVKQSVEKQEPAAVKPAEQKAEKSQRGQAAAVQKSEKEQQSEKPKTDQRQDEFYQIMERLIQQLSVPNRSEDRFKRLDAAIRKHQYSRRLVAATEEQGKKRKKKYSKG